MVSSLASVLLNFLTLSVVTASLRADFEPKKIKPLSKAKKEPFTAVIIQRDDLGVERSTIPFVRRPRLHINVRRDLFWRDRKSLTRVQRATELLRHDMESNALLVNSWTIGLIKRPDLYTDPVKLAAYVYSMSKPYYLFSSFNGAVSSFKEDSDYSDFRYKGLYALLLMSSRPYKQHLYRGATSKVEAEKNTYIRFNRFSSTTANLTTAMLYATRKTTPGTLIIFQGMKDATLINHKDTVLNDDEYLIEPDTQFRVSQVIDGPVSDTNPGRVIVLTRAYYPSALTANSLI